MIKAIIFDMDGTILDTIKDIYFCLNETLNFYHYPIKTIEQTRLALGNGSRRLIKDCLPDNVEEKIVDELTSHYLELYHQHYNNETKPYEGIVELLAALEKRNILLAINSNKPNDLANNLVKQHFKNIHFIEVIGSRPHIPNKPDPYSCNEIMEKYHLKNEEVIYIGDSEADILTAKNAKIKAIACLWGFRDLQTLKKTQCDYLISKPSEVLDII